MSDERIASHLDAIYDAASGAPEIIEHLSKAEFLTNRTAKLAAVMTLVIIGEAAARILQQHPEYAASHPEIPWPNIRSMRNRGAHGYDDLNFETVWDTVTNDLPVLAAQTKLLLGEFGGPLPPQIGS
ncbi:hypothetical protein VW23_003740 [Devosia insulae DS-56]|uniref:DUF86 domain-containing protein n=1 Tax=Devosia insulae DS-56 TaxID=1116389 RepID=A0A1E5XJ65_9HYPH|nr:HepT-like ribonuclease domain-containing protein [Devosia insulae]OEO28564.1 hypothetical protein VW23_003740 [Devosia insulae DS-56]